MQLLLLLVLQLFSCSSSLINIIIVPILCLSSGTVATVSVGDIATVSLVNKAFSIISDVFVPTN